LLEAGFAVRHAALVSVPHGVHVLFRRLDGSCEGFYMAHATYDAIPYGEPATPDDYRRFGPPEAAPDTFKWGSVNKAV
jgi:hypothetical protein